MSWRRSACGLLVAGLAALMLIACTDEIETAPAELVATDDGEGSLVEQLAANADAFAYEIGTFGGTITFATIAEPLTFNLALANDAGSARVVGTLFEGLTEVSWLTDEVEPALAESWDVSSDGLTWTFYLRRDVRWHDGEAFTAADVAFTFNQIIYNDDIPTPDRAAFIFRFINDAGEWEEARMNVTAIDEFTVQFALPVSFAPFLRSMGQAIYPEHILAEAIAAGEFTETWGIDTDPSEIIGTGPFRIESYEAGERVLYRRNPDYWLTDDDGNRLPYLERMVLLIVEDLEAELEAFRSGDIDVHGVRGEDYADLEPLQDAENFTLIRRGPTFSSNFVMFNMNPGMNSDSGDPLIAAEKLRWFTTLEFRRAVAHSIDKDRIIEEVQHSFGSPQWGDISPAAGDFHNPDVRTYEYDLEGGNALLDGLGWVDRDDNGFREDDEGNEIAFLMVTNTQNTVRQQVAGIIHEGMLELGLNVELEIIEFSDMIDQLTSSYDWEAMIIGLTGGTEPHGGMVVWHSSGSLHMWHPNQPEPATAWEAEIDDLYIRGSQELDREVRVSYYHRAEEIIAENLPLIYTTHPERISAVRNVFGNTTPTLYGLWDTRYLYRTDN